MSASRFLTIATLLLGLAFASNASAAVSADGPMELASICRRMRAAYDAYYTTSEMLKDEAARKRHLEDADPAKIFVEELKLFSIKHRGMREGLMGLRQLVLLGAGGGEPENPRDLGRRFAITQLETYGQSPELPEILRYLDVGNYDPAVEQFLRTFAQSGEASSANQQFSKFMLARLSLAQVDARDYMERRLRELQDGAESGYPGEAERLRSRLEIAVPLAKLQALEKEAIQLLEMLASSTTGFRQPAIKADDEDWLFIRAEPEPIESMPLVSELAAGVLFKHRHLRIGQPAPKLEIELIDGSDWSLAEQRGKVVIVQFSFKGCGPCEAMYPDLRGLQTAHPDSLSVLSIMADKDSTVTQEAVRSGQLNWCVSWDGQRGPTITQWGVKSFPTIYVIDSKGMIAALGLRGERLKEKIADLLERQSN